MSTEREIKQLWELALVYLLLVVLFAVSLAQWFAIANLKEEVAKNRLLHGDLAHYVQHVVSLGGDTQGGGLERD